MAVPSTHANAIAVTRKKITVPRRARNSTARRHCVNKEVTIATSVVVFRVNAIEPFTASVL